MILDFNIGASRRQMDYSSFGAGWTWVSGEGAAPVVIAGPYRYRALGIHDPGAASIGTHTPGMVIGGIHDPGSGSGEII